MIHNIIDITKNPLTADEIIMLRKRYESEVLKTALKLLIVFVVLMLISCGMLLFYDVKYTSQITTIEYIAFFNIGVFVILFMAYLTRLYVLDNQLAELNPITPEQTERLLFLLGNADVECRRYHQQVCDLEREYIKAEYKILTERLVKIWEDNQMKERLSRYKECLCRTS